MEQIKLILDGSLLWRWVNALCLWLDVQWQNSCVVQWFLHPAVWGRAASESSVFFRLWSCIRALLCRIYAALKLDRLFTGSIFCCLWIWCAFPVVLAPLLDFWRPSLMVAGLVLIAFASFLLNFVRNQERQLTWLPTNRYVILYAVVYLTGTIFSVDLTASLEPGLLSVCFILFSLVLVNAVSGRKQLDFLLDLVVLAGALVSFYGVLQYLFRWGYQSAAWVDNDMFSSIRFRVSATLQNPNMLGEYLILIIPLGGAGLLSARSWEKRLFYLGCCTLMCGCMLLTFSRGAWLGLLFAGAAFAVLISPRLLFLLPFALAAMYFFLPSDIVARFTSIGNLTDHSTSYRVYIWLGTLAMLKDYWLCGIGPGDAAFNMVYPAYSYSLVIAPHSHNLLLQIVCDAGICALVIFLLLLFSYFRMMCTALSRETEWKSRIYQIAFTSGVFGFMVQAMTDYSFYNYRVMLLFWAYLSLGGLCTQRSRMSEGRLLV